MTLSDVTDRRTKMILDLFKRRAEQAKAAIPRPVGMVESPKEAQQEKYADFRTILTAAAQGSPEAGEALKGIIQKFGLKELTEDIVRTDRLLSDGT